MSVAAPAHSRTDDRRARRNAFILCAAQAMYGAGASIIITLGGLAGHYLAIDKGLATLPVTTFVLGTAVSTVPASLFMKAVGRRIGFMTGAGFGIASSLLAVHALFNGSFLLFCLATFLAGAYQASSMYYRFAAADTASDAFKAKAISWVLAGGIAAAILGPQVVIWTRALFEPVLFAGTFAASAGLSLLGFAILNFLDIPKPSEQVFDRPPRPLAEILRQKRLLVAIFCGMVSYGIMNLVMTATPLAMVACNHTVDDAAFVIQWHILAMFAPSFFTGHLINRFGVERIIAAGCLLLTGAGIAALSGIGIIHFWIALVLLGIGWNFGFVGATAMVTDCYHPSERNKVQAANDMAVFAAVVLASFSSGNLLHHVGWEAVAWSLFPFVASAMALVVLQTFRQRRTA